MTISFQSSPPPHVTDSGHYSNTHCWWAFEFPNGRSAHIELSKYPFRFDLSYDFDDLKDSTDFTAVDLTSEQVEAKLTEIAEMPAPQSHRMVGGSHERPDGAECRCGAAWDRWNDECATTAVTR